MKRYIKFTDELNPQIYNARIDLRYGKVYPTSRYLANKFISECDIEDYICDTIDGILWFHITDSISNVPSKYLHPEQHM